jgi:tRNA(fMet)-specific endonuclease VapC
MDFIADTNVVSFIHKGDSRGETYRALLTGHAVGVSFASVAELYRWSIIRAWGKMRTQLLLADLKRYLTLPPDDATAWEWAEIRSIPGHPISSDDAGSRPRPDVIAFRWSPTTANISSTSLD